jgi:hypothetical protein
MAISKVKSGPALVIFYNAPRINGEDLGANRASTVTTTVLAYAKHIDRVDQLQDASVKFERDQFPHQTQLSSKPVKYLQVGIEPTLELSIASIDLPNIGDVFDVNVLKEYTASVVGVSTATEDRIDIGDNAGSIIEGRAMQILPYPLIKGYALNNGYDPFSDANLTAYTTAGVSASAQKEWLETVITFPNAKIVDVNQTNLVYGLQTQQEIRVAIKGSPDQNGERMYFGDYSL